MILRSKSEVRPVSNSRPCFSMCASCWANSWMIVIFVPSLSVVVDSIIHNVTSNTTAWCKLIAKKTPRRALIYSCRLATSSLNLCLFSAESNILTVTLVKLRDFCLCWNRRWRAAFFSRAICKALSRCRCPSVIPFSFFLCAPEGAVICHTLLTTPALSLWCRRGDT